MGWPKPVAVPGKKPSLCQSCQDSLQPDWRLRVERGVATEAAVLKHAGVPGHPRPAPARAPSGGDGGAQGDQWGGPGHDLHTLLLLLSPLLHLVREIGLGLLPPLSVEECRTWTHYSRNCHYSHYSHNFHNGHYSH